MRYTNRYSWKKFEENGDYMTAIQLLNKEMEYNYIRTQRLTITSENANIILELEVAYKTTAYKAHLPASITELHQLKILQVLKETRNEMIELMKQL